ncbi:MAG: hypothetical protein MK102_04750 [Fuerstiella sp.]|nr:hypothetical protein [Fuerstiella sp.]
MHGTDKPVAHSNKDTQESDAKQRQMEQIASSLNPLWMQLEAAPWHGWTCRRKPL